MAIQGHTFCATATKHHHPDISHLSVSVAVVFLCIAIVNAAIVTHPERRVLAQLCFPQDDLNLPMCLYYQDFDHAQIQDFETQPPVTPVRHKGFWYPHFRW